MSVANYQSDLAKQQAAEDAARQEKQNQAVWFEVLAKFPVRDTEANFRLFVTYSNPLTLAAADHLIKAKTFGVDMSSREEIIRDLIETVKGPVEKRSLAVRMPTWSLR